MVFVRTFASGHSASSGTRPVKCMGRTETHQYCMSFLEARIQPEHRVYPSCSASFSERCDKKAPATTHTL
eukprot:3287983-Pyramimonas_sp.AAC.1